MAGLEVSGVAMSFGGNRVLDDVSLTVEPGQVTGLIGPNGAGKTTLFNIVSGLLDPSAGRIVLDGRDVTKAGPAARARGGLSRTYQQLELFTSLSVRDNVRVAGEIRNAWGRRYRTNVRAETDRVMGLLGLDDVADREVGELPTARARIIEVARALMTKPRVLLLDEPASGQTERRRSSSASCSGSWWPTANWASAWSSTTSRSSWGSVPPSTSSTTAGSSPRGRPSRSASSRR